MTEISHFRCGAKWSHAKKQNGGHFFQKTKLTKLLALFCDDFS